MKNLQEIARQGRIDEEASLTDRQSIIINCPIEEVWTKIIDVANWSSWNEQITDVDGDPKKPGDSFSWRYHGKKLNSTIEYVNTHNAIAIVGKSGFAKSIYLFTLDKTEETQTIVTLEQSVKGFLSFLFINHGGLHHSLLDWLDALRNACEKQSSLA